MDCPVPAVTGGAKCYVFGRRGLGDGSEAKEERVPAPVSEQQEKEVNAGAAAIGQSTTLLESTTDSRSDQRFCNQQAPGTGGIVCRWLAA